MSFSFFEIYKQFSEADKTALQEFKDEAFYFVGKDIKDFDFWQQFLNLFYIFHVLDENNKTFAQKHNLKIANLFLYYPSMFSQFKGTDFFSEEKLIFSTENSSELDWFQEKEFIFSFFYKENENIEFVETKTSFLISNSHQKFLKKIKKLYKSEKYSKNFIFFILIVLFLKKERYEPSKLYSPFVLEEFEKIAKKYEKFLEKFN